MEEIDTIERLLDMIEMEPEELAEEACTNIMLYLMATSYLNGMPPHMSYQYIGSWLDFPHPQEWRVVATGLATKLAERAGGG